jgi:uncharacterized membrane protein SpoIIM required for sporulation
MKIKQKTLKDLYKESWNFILESKKQIYFSIILFFLFVLVGFFLPVPAEIEKIIYEKLREIVMMFKGLNLFETTWMIFSNNLYVSFISIVFGLSLGIVPFFLTLFNGYIIGFVFSKAVSLDGALILLKTIPYGIFELSAVLVSLGLGIRIGTTIFTKEKTFDIFKKSLRVLVLFIVPLLLVAAILEGVLIFYF